MRTLQKTLLLTFLSFSQICSAATVSSQTSYQSGVNSVSTTVEVYHSITPFGGHYSSGNTVVYPSLIALGSSAGSFTNNSGGTSVTITPNENQTAATTITTTGLTGTVSYTLGGTDSASFSIDGNGVLTFSSVPNYETKSSYTVTVTATGSNGAITQTITVNVQNANEAPSFTNSGTTTATEDSAYTYTPTVSDIDSNLTSISGTNLPSWLSLTQSNSLVSTLAGSTSGSTDATGTAARFRDPASVAVDSSGNIFVADSSNNKIRKITPDGNVSTLAGSGSYGSSDGAGTAAKFFYPYGVAVDSNGTVYVADTYSNKIRKITPDGNVSTFAGSGSYGSSDGAGTVAKFSYPMGVAVDSNGTVYVADTNSHKIRKITPEGVVSTFAGSTRGNTDGAGTNASFFIPNSLAVDSSGNVFVADTYNNKIRKITPAGVVSTLAGSGTIGNTNGTGTAASFKYPSGVAVDNSGNVFVADTSNNKIRKITPAGVVSTLAGSGTIGNTNGTGTAASFIMPMGVAVDSSGNVYVADTSNYRIRKISAPTLNLQGTPTVSGVYDVNLSVTDGDLNATQNFQITVADVNDAPLLDYVSFVISENNATGSTVGTLTATDEDGVNPSLALIGSAEVITYSIVFGNTNSDFAINSTTGEITVAKQLNATTTQIYELVIKAQDDGGASNRELVIISVSNEADAPIAVADTSTINEDSNATINLVSNDTDTDNNLNNSSVVITAQPSNGTVSVNASGVANYIPHANYNGSDYFTYKVSDATSLSSNEVNVTITVTAVNDAPVATNQTVSTEEDTNTTILLREYVTDIDGDNLTYSIVSGTSSGTATISDGIISYDPNLNFYGFDSFTYKANDGTTDSQTKTININVAEVNDIPIANHDYENNTTEDTAFDINVLTNDSDDNGLNPATVEIVLQPSHGSVVVINGVVTYEPDTNYHGQDSFEYTVKDDGVATGTQGTGVLISNNALVTINISSVNDAPTANNDSATLNEDSVMLLNLHSNDTDVDDDLNGTAITIVTQPSHGEANVTESGLVRYIPTKDYSGADSFTYKISDGDVNSSTATVSLTITAVNDAPSITTDANQTHPENSTATIVTLAASDVESNTPLTFTKLAGKDEAHFSLSGSDLSATETPALAHQHI